MTSIRTNIAALTSLRSVNSLNDQLTRSAERIATGRKIPNARDGATKWALATRIETDVSTSSTVRDALAVTKGVLEAANVGLGVAKTGLTDIRNLLVAARSTGVNRADIQSDIAAIQASLKATATEATVGGLGILAQKNVAGYNPVKTFVAGVSDTGTANQVATITLDIRGVALTNDTSDKGILDKTRTAGSQSATILSIDVSALTDSASDLAKIDNFITMVDAALGDVVNATSTVGATSDRVTNQTNFLDKIETIKATAASSLVDANLEEEAAIKDALVVRQQLAIEALSIANSSLANILKLFQ